MKRLVLPALAVGALWLVWIWAAAFALAKVSGERAWVWTWRYDVARNATPLARWDSGWYFGIAERGYDRPPERSGVQTNHAFFPLYPLVMRAIIRVTGCRTAAAGNAVSAAGLLLGLPFYAAWAARRFPKGETTRTVLSFLLFPFAFFLAAVYAEGLAFGFLAMALWAAESDRPILLAVSGTLAGLTRIAALAFVPALLLVAWRRIRERRDSPARGLAALAAALSPLAGFAVFCAYFARRFGDPFLFVRAQHNWATKEKTVLDGPRLLVEGVVRSVQTGKAFDYAAHTLEPLALLGAILALVPLLRRRLVAEAALVAGTVGLVLASGTVDSAGRYLVLALPLFPLVASMTRRRGTAVALAILGGALQIVLLRDFILSRWAG